MSLVICSMPACQTTAGCICEWVSRPVFKSMSDFTDEEIAIEHRRRMMKKLQQWVSVPMMGEE